jgi:hypothetical protein
LEALKSSFWFDPESKRLLANGLGYANPASLFHGTARMVNVLSLAGPGVSHNIQRALNVRNLQRKNPITREQADYLDHKGSYLPEPRLRDMDIQGIDQVLIIPTDFEAYPWIQDRKSRCRLRAGSRLQQLDCRLLPRSAGAAVRCGDSAFATYGLSTRRDASNP